MTVAALVTDLLFATKIRSTAEAVGTQVRLMRSTADLLTAAAESSLVLVDMNASGVDPVDAVAQLRAAQPGIRIVAFLSHVQRELAEAARAAGADEVMPRSVFSARLPDLLATSQGK